MSAELVIDVVEPALAVLQVAASELTPRDTESLSIRSDGVDVAATEVRMPGSGRAHRLVAPAGRLTVRYDATVTGRSEPAGVTAADEITYLRPSRYSESDRLAAIAAAEFASAGKGRDLLAAVSSWVGTRLSYVPGSSGPTDGAVDTLLLRQGVCRDYAHLVVALLRAMDVPARLAAVYAPGLEPMDFHAVAEAAIDGQWYVVDATTLAPRSTLLRISTGRDAADTAFLSTYQGQIELVASTVTATVDGELPDDDVTELVQLG